VKLGSLKLRNSYGINITRVNRAGIDLLPSRSLRLQLGDKLTIVGESRSIENVSTILGNQAKELSNPNLFTIFVGIVLGLVLGSIPFAFPGMSMPVKLGIAGGPIITGLLMGAFGPRLHLSIYMSRSANLMLRQLGLTIYLAGLGLSAGAGFFDTVFSAEGLIWVLASFSLAVVPVLITGFAAAKIFKTDYADNVGMLCGSMANPFALDFANPSGEGDDPAVAYATVYPASIFLRVISAQIIMLMLG
jgi:AspT/YidE/YbjL antiporter-like protein